MAAKNSSPELRFGDWEDEDVDELLSSECQCLKSHCCYYVLRTYPSLFQ